MSRHSAREKSVMFLYQMEVRDENDKDLREAFLSQYPFKDEGDKAYFEFLVDHVTKHRRELDEIIEKYLRGWTLERQSFIDLSILRIAVLELLFDTSVPVEIAISEAVILADKYGDDNSRPFINAVLGNIEKNESSRVNQEDSHVTVDLSESAGEMRQSDRCGES